MLKCSKLSDTPPQVQISSFLRVKEFFPLPISCHKLTMGEHVEDLFLYGEGLL